MADKSTQYYLDASEYGIRKDAAPNLAELQKKLFIAEFDITLATGYITADDNYVLGKLGQAARIFPTHSFLVGTSGAVSGVFRLEKVAAAGGSPTTVGANVTIATDGTAVAFAAANGAITADEYLQLTINTATDLANGDTLKLYVAYLPTVDVIF